MIVFCRIITLTSTGQYHGGSIWVLKEDTMKLVGGGLQCDTGFLSPPWWNIMWTLVSFQRRWVMRVPSPLSILPVPPPHILFLTLFLSLSCGGGQFVPLPTLPFYSYWLETPPQPPLLSPYPPLLVTVYISPPSFSP